MTIALQKLCERHCSEMGDKNESPKPVEPIPLPEWVKKVKPSGKKQGRRALSEPLASKG
jgi:hypothetical protein